MRPLTLATVGFPSAAIAWNLQHRRSTAVRSWRPSAHGFRRAGPLHVRTAGSGDRVIVLLHGLVATGDIFGASFDVLDESSTLVVPDLLGFGRSLDQARNSFTGDDHLDALDAMLNDLGLDGRRIVVGAHSMGVAVAVRWAARHRSRCLSVIGFGAPVYPDAATVDDAITASGPMARVFAANTRWAEAACHLSCKHRTLAGWLAAVATPGLPVPISRAAALHTWPAYRDAIVDVVSATDWPTLTSELERDDVAVDLIWGEHDQLGDRDVAAALPGVSIGIIAGADHHLPLTHPGLCVERLASTP